MSFAMEYRHPLTAAEAPADVRAAFIRRTYVHLAGAILAFAGIEAVLLNLPGIENTVFGLMRASRYSWLVVLGGFMLVSWLADRWARSETSPGMQYAGLALYVLAEAVIFLPLLLIADRFFAGEHLIAKAAILTLATFAGLTLGVLVTGKDFSFLRTALTVGGVVAFGLILAGVLFGFTLGLWFTLGMIAFACAAILYYTSQVLHHYRPEQHVAAALTLFAAVALLFWYVLQLLMRSRN
jgi:FtsH-binding integral membrane protein